MANNLKKILLIIATIVGSTFIGSSLIIDNNIQMETTNKGIDSLTNIDVEGDATFDRRASDFTKITGRVKYTASTLLDSAAPLNIRVIDEMDFLEIVVVEKGRDPLNSSDIKGSHNLSSFVVSWNGDVNDDIPFELTNLVSSTEYDVYALESYDGPLRKNVVGSPFSITTSILKDDPLLEKYDIIYSNNTKPTKPSASDGKIDIKVHNSWDNLGKDGEFTRVFVEDLTKPNGTIELSKNLDIFTIQLTGLVSGSHDLKFSYEYSDGVDDTLVGSMTFIKDIFIEENDDFATLGSVILSPSIEPTTNSITVDVTGNNQNSADLSVFSVMIAKRGEDDAIETIDLPTHNRFNIEFSSGLTPNTEYDIAIFGNKLDNDDKFELGTILEVKTKGLSSKVLIEDFYSVNKTKASSPTSTDGEITYLWTLSSIPNGTTISRMVIEYEKNGSRTEYVISDIDYERGVWIAEDLSFGDGEGKMTVSSLLNNGSTVDDSDTDSITVGLKEAKIHPTIDLLTTKLINIPTEQDGAELKSEYSIAEDADDPADITNITVSLWKKGDSDSLELKTLDPKNISGTISDWNKANTKNTGEYYTKISVEFNNGHSIEDVKDSSDTVHVVAWEPDPIVIQTPTAVITEQDWGDQNGSLTSIQTSVDNIINMYEVKGTLIQNGGKPIYEDVAPNSINGEIVSFPDALNLVADDYEIKIFDANNINNSSSLKITIEENITKKPSIDDVDKPTIVEPGEDGSVKYDSSNLKVVIDVKLETLINPKFIFNINGLDNNIEIDATLDLPNTYRTEETYVLDEEITFNASKGYTILFESYTSSNEKLVFELIVGKQIVVEGDNGFSGGAIAGIIVAFLAGATGIGAGLYWYFVKDGAAILKNKLNMMKVRFKKRHKHS